MKLISLILSLLIAPSAFADGKITNADIYSAAAIATTKLAAKTANNVATYSGTGFLGNGIAPSTSGNILTSNGTLWTSASPGNLTDAGTDGITVTAGTGAVLGAGTSLAQQVSDATHNGYLSSTNWSTFNSKQAAGNYITALTGDVTASGPGSVAATLATVNGNVGSFTNGSFTVNGKGLITAASSGTAPVTSLTVASANGFAGSFSASTTPVLTLTTTITGVLSGNGTAISAASTTGSGSVVLATSPTIVTPTIAKLANLTTNGFVRTSAGDGTLGVQTDPCSVAEGCTGAVTLTNHGVVIGQATSAVAVTTAGTAGNVLTSNGASADPTFQAPASATLDTSDQLTNVGCKATVSASAMTIALTQKDMSTAPASGSGAVIIAVKTNSATGGYSAVSTTGALTTVVSSGSTLGCTSAVACTQYLYMLSNGELAYSSSQMVDEGSLVSTTAEGGAGAADTKNVLYSTTARSNVGARLICRIVTTQATAGTWATTPSETSVPPFIPSIKPSVCVLDSGNGHGSTNTNIRNFSNATNVGTGCTGANNATNGAAITLNEDGSWCCSYTDFRATSSTEGGISVNSNQLTTSILSITIFSGPGTNGRLCSYTAPGVSLYGSCASCFQGFIGDVVRAHDDTGMNSTAAPGMIRCAKVGGY